MRKEVPAQRIIVAYPPCEAPQHVDTCDGIGSTKDHFTPKCIAKVLKWTQEETDDPSNIQHLSSVCHNEKDSSTPARRDQLLLQLQGRRIGLGEHITILYRSENGVHRLDSRDASIVFIQDQSDGRVSRRARLRNLPV